MFKVGLTGGIASGKSTVSRMLAAEGVPVICLDEIARGVVKPGSPALEDIRRAFGPEFINDKGELDRERMGREVFNDASKRRLLESITHPRILLEKNARIDELGAQGHCIVAVDVPLLYEIGYERDCDVVVVVYVPEQVQKKRLMDRDSMTAEEARSRIAAQMPIEEKKARADYLIDNTLGLDKTGDEVRAMIAMLKEKARSVAHKPESPCGG